MKRALLLVPVGAALALSRMACKTTHHTSTPPGGHLSSVVSSAPKGAPSTYRSHPSAPSTSKPPASSPSKPCPKPAPSSTGVSTAPKTPTPVGSTLASSPSPAPTSPASAVPPATVVVATAPAPASGGIGTGVSIAAPGPVALANTGPGYLLWLVPGAVVVTVLGVACLVGAIRMGRRR